MAFFTPSCLISEIRGSVGNQTFSRNAHGNIVKEKLVQTNPDTARQQEFRGHMGEAVTAWQGLTQPQRNQWYTLGRDTIVTDSLGVKRIQNGYHLFIQRKLNLLKINQAGTPVLGIKPIIPAITRTELREDGGDRYMDVFMKSSTTLWRLCSRFSDVTSPTIKMFNPSLMRLYHNHIFYQNGLELDLGAAFVALYGSPSPSSGETSWISLQGVHVATGQATVPYVIPIVWL
jgi:hypothetical protein